MRTHYCGALDASLVDQQVTLCGWVHRRRDHGGVIFIDLRDRAGLAQVVVNPEDAAAFAIAEQVRKATGRNLVIGGDIDLDIGLATSVSLSDVTLSNASWGTGPEMIKLSRLRSEEHTSELQSH